MTRTEIFHEELLSLDEAAARHLPEQGGIELQRDQPGKIHSWHSHSVHETLVVLGGDMLVEYVEVYEGRDTVYAATAKAGTRIELPLNTVHQSTAGASGCDYLIIPEGGRAARTTSHSAPEPG
jgi:quercetin dioxygenase-like cupin family protein